MPSVRLLGQSCQLGISGFVGELSSGVTTTVFNFLLLGLAGNVGVAAYGVVANFALVATAIFNGVAQVVSRLFDLVKPAKAYFGEKDFQQIAVIREMVRQLRIPVEIIPCPIVRGEDGLALSSRNTLLDTDHRTAAPYIYKVLKAAVEKSHQTTPDQLAAWVTAQVESNPLLKVIYFQVVDAATMQQVRTWEESPAIQGCIAVQAGDIRLIDNIKLR
jgi:pantoate--beta-alanine ligase